MGVEVNICFLTEEFYRIQCLTLNWVHIWHFVNSKHRKTRDFHIHLKVQQTMFTIHIHLSFQTKRNDPGGDGKIHDQFLMHISVKIW